MRSLGPPKINLYAATTQFVLFNPEAFRGVPWPPSSAHFSAMATVTIGRSYFEALLRR
jgi:hypothetical protein